MTSRALVLGGGGIAARAWEVGLLSGLSAAGIDLRGAELVVGTSAGALLAAQLGCGADLEQLYREELADRPRPGAPGSVPPPASSSALRPAPTSAPGRAAGGAEDEVRPEPGRPSRGMALRLALARCGTTDPVRYRMRVGRWAKEAETPTERRLLRCVGSRLPGPRWPAQRLLVTSVDADTGEFLAFDRDTQVSLVEAVAASCAAPGVWPPVRLFGRHWIDGGLRSATNADLATGHDRVVVLAPSFGGNGPITRDADQLAALRRTGRALLLVPGSRSRRAMGRDATNPRNRARVARAARAETATVREAVAEIWLG